MMIDTQKGTRHPHSLNASFEIANRVPMITNKEINKPTVAVVCIHEVQ